MSRDYEEEYEDGYEDEYYDEFEARREYRHKRNVRNRIIAFAVMIFLVLAIAVGGFFAVSSVLNSVNDKKEAEMTEEELEDDEENDEQIVIEAPSEE